MQIYDATNIQQVLYIANNFDKLNCWVYAGIRTLFVNKFVHYNSVITVINKYNMYFLSKLHDTSVECRQ